VAARFWVGAFVVARFWVGAFVVARFWVGAFVVARFWVGPLNGRGVERQASVGRPTAGLVRLMPGSAEG